jgi:hypothetical protein
MLALLAVMVLAVLSTVASGAERNVGPAYPIKAFNGRELASASAVPVAVHSTSGRTVFLTTAHNFEGLSADIWWVWNEAARDWKQITRVHMDTANDVATFEAAGNWPMLSLIEDESEVPDDTPVVVCGYGADLSKEKACFSARSHMSGRWPTLTSVDGAGVIPGDSGGAVVVRSQSGKRCLLGLVQSFSRPTRRTVESQFVPASACRQILYRHYGSLPQCTPWGCPAPSNYQRYERIEPQPFNYPRVERYEQIGTPQPSKPKPQPSPPTLDMDDIRAEINTTVVDWLERNREQLRGPKGADGRDGVNGADGKPGKDAADISVSQIAQYLVENHAEQLGASRRVVIVSGGQVLDDETYGPNEAIVLDLQRISRQVSED